MFFHLNLRAVKRLFQIRDMVRSLTGVTPKISDLISSIILSVELVKLEEAFCSSEDNIL